ncbi:MAG: small basic protein [Candidatus Omnitrophica bacterium CG11_big_fil_rev_8_21_14_0_20_45_26]|uniref:Small basic protein n=1 Tax=Candidatus Abzuiibacterium crystallinum TaxID=1974748 RepID=A0A2H0LPL5_9BACT|nr:MAG: small basic protein [Candidatus Omnitrophica bacterium CG11_big_fil_rev_8_21_14_0_20_45_26]PIW64333.1 MAG: small basic protein [Candidatus Omnitrophica bacterium CG12_big_fil_rev_8_21_14_0_65_45_16]
MSQHPSLRVSSVGAKHRNVFKRHEKIKKLQENENWLEHKTAFKLPKIKSVKVKVKKIKAEKAEGAEGEATAPAAAKPAAEEKKAK